jgi:hypothetical protein
MLLIYKENIKNNKLCVSGRINRAGYGRSFFMCVCCCFFLFFFFGFVLAFVCMQKYDYIYMLLIVIILFKKKCLEFHY